MFVVSLVSRIGPVLRPSNHPFTAGNACARRERANVIRAALRKTDDAGGSHTPTVCLLIALIVAAIVITGALSATSVGDELGRAVRLTWWFA